MSAAPPPRCSLIYLPLPKAVPLLLQFLQNAPRDADKLRRLLEIKERQKEEADDDDQDAEKAARTINSSN